MTKRGLWHAILNPSSPRHDDWLRILGTHEVPLKSARTHHADLGEERNVELYKLDIAGLSTDQRERLVHWIRSKFPTATALDDVEGSRAFTQQINDQLDTVGFPIRFEDVIVSFDYRGFM